MAVPARSTTTECSMKPWRSTGGRADHSKWREAMAKMNHWRAAKLYRRMTTDHRFEHELPDRADKWLSAVERRQQRARARNREHGQQSFEFRRPISITASSTEEAPW